MGGGDNSLISAGTIGGNLSYDGGSGNDTIELNSPAATGRNVAMRLGEGTNSFNLTGTIAGNLDVERDRRGCVRS